MGRISAAAEALAEAVRLDPEVAFYRFRLANVHVRLARIEDATRSLEVAVALEPCDDYYLALLAICYQMTNRYSDAIRCLEQAVRVRPDSGAYRWLLAEGCHLAGRAQEAETHHAAAGSLDEYDWDYVRRLQTKFLMHAEWERPTWG
jgi:tetratricopeptide (TPR) repeat protein